MANILGSIVGAAARGALVKAGSSRVAKTQTTQQTGRSGALVVRNTKVNVGRAFPSSGRTPAAPGAIVKSSRGGMSLLDDVIVIKTKVIQIEKLIKNNTLLDRSREETKRKGQRRENFEKREEKLETPKNASAGAKKAQADVPKLGLFGVIKRWLFWTFVGWLFNKYGDQLPKLIPVVKMLGNVAEGIFNFAGNLLKGAVDFIDFGYKAYDNVRNLAKTIGGENLQQTFDSFSENFNTFLNLALIAGMATMGGGGFGGGGAGKGVGGRAAGGFGGRPRITTSGGGRAGGIDIRNPFRARPEITTSGGGRAGGVDIRNPFRARPKVTGMGGVAEGFGGRAARIFGKGLGRIPIIGGLIDFVINLAMGEPVGRAAAKAVGSTLGAALGTFIPVPFAGTILGGILGDIVGGAVYDTFFKPKDKTKKMAAGGKVSIQQGQQKGPIRRKTTRGGKTVGSSVTRGGRRTTVGAARAVTVAPTTRTPILKQIGLKVGSAVGGLFNLFGLFPNPAKDKDKKVADASKEPNPMGFLEESYKASSRTPFFGALFSVLTKTILGDRATKLDYKSVAQGLVGLFNQAFADGILRGPASAFASGGVIDLVNAGDSGEFSSWLEKTVESSVAPKMNDVRQDLMRQLMLEKQQQDEKKPGTTGDPPGTPEPAPGGVLTPGQWGPLLDVIRSVEGGWESISGRKPIKGLTGWTISEIAKSAPSYAGAYQLDPNSVIGWAKNVGLKPDDKFTPQNQNKIAIGLIEGRAQGSKWVKGEISDAKFGNNLATIWAGLPVLSDVSGKRRGSSYYAGVSWNKANTSPEKVETALSKVKKGGYSQQELASSTSGVLGADKASNVDQFTSIAKQFGLTLTSSYRPGDPGYHGKNRARDYSNDAVGNGTPEQMKFAQHLVKTYGSSLKQLIYTPLGYGISDGKKVGLDYWGDKTNSQHYHHVHVALFRGGSTKKGGPILTHPGEFVIDKDSVDLFGLDFIQSINDVENRANFITKSYDLIGKLKKLVESPKSKETSTSDSSKKPEGKVIPGEEKSGLDYKKMQGGGYIGKNKPSMNLSPLQTQASYEAQGTMMAIQPVIVEKVVQSQGSAGSKIMFGGSSVNSDSNLAAHMRG